jgi:4-diphosphocytidyl-2-C-methyl-D-erythritol kinase
LQARIQLPAYAKINLGLRVLGKRPDGYHEIETFFLQIDLADYLFFQLLHEPGIRFSCNWPELAETETNLCVKACRLLEKIADCRFGIDIYLEKSIPYGAGLGGGSSDAAVTLVAVNALYNMKLSHEELGTLAAQLGSDVSFFLHGGLAYASGRGEIVTPLNYLPVLWVLIVKPEVSVSTKWAYDNLKFGLTNTKKNTTFASLKNSFSGIDTLREVCQNDMEEAVFSRHPELAAIKCRLQDVGAFPVSMTGSGSAIFGIFETQHALREGLRVFGKSYRTFVARPIRSGMEQVLQHFTAATSGG